MVQNDSQHSGSVQTGPTPPLKRIWRSQATSSDSFTTWPIVSKGVVYASSGPGVLAVRAQDGKRIWFTQPKEGQKQVSPALDDKALYIPIPHAQVLALDRRTGQEIWRFQADESINASPSIVGDKLYFGSADASVFYCVSTEGHLVWKKTTELLPNSIPAIANGIVVFPTEHIGSDRVLVLALNADTGAEVWHSEQKEGTTSPSILGESVVFGGGDFFAHTLDLRTGREIWKSPVEGKFSERNIPALAFGDVFLADRDGAIYRLDGSTGKRKWIFKDTEGTMDQSFPVIAGKTLFIGSGSGGLYALDTDTGHLLWKGQVNGFVLSGAADSEHFYFGVKFGDEGLYAYGHDPNGKLYSAPASPGSARSLVSGSVLFALVLGVAVILLRRRFKRAGDVSR